MRKLFYAGAIGLVLFEAANIYFIMPLPGSQRLPSIDVAYFLHSWRWPVRVALVAMILAGAAQAWAATGWRKAFVPVAIVVAGAVTVMANFVMSADRIFVQPATLMMEPASLNAVDTARLVVGIVVDGDARAYPIQFIGYHHQVRDSAGGRPVMVSYCTVCRTGRVFAPIVDGKLETFRLVGMNRFNAMFEDASTGSWWRQANGEAIAGPLKGTMLAEIPSWQVSLAQWLALHPESRVMQADPAMVAKYSSSFDYESGASTSALTGTDTVSWSEKAWVVGLTVNGASRAYDWNRLKRERVVNDTLGGRAVVVVLARDDKSYFAFMRPDAATRFELRGDSLASGSAAYALSGKGPGGELVPVFASQEFWHSWRTFQPGTTKY